MYKSKRSLKVYEASLGLNGKTAPKIDVQCTNDTIIINKMKTK